MKPLSICQQYLLCILNEKGVIKGYTAEKRVCLLAACVLEMRLDGCIKVEQKQIRVVKPLPERLSYFKPLYDFLYEKSPIKIIKMLDAYNISLTDKKFQELFCSLGDSLCEKEAAERCKAGLLSKKGYRPDREAVDTIIEKMKKEFNGKGKLRDNSAALLTLLDRSHHLGEYVEKEEQKRMLDYLNTASEAVNGQTLRQQIVYIQQVLSTLSLTSAVPKK